MLIIDGQIGHDPNGHVGVRDCTLNDGQRSITNRTPVQYSTVVDLWIGALNLSARKLGAGMESLALTGYDDV